MTSDNKNQDQDQEQEQEKKDIEATVQEILSDRVEHEEELAPLSKLRQLSEVSKTAVIQVPMWGDLLVRKKITHITGEPGIGKTTFTYTFGLHVSNAMEFLGILPLDNKPLKTLIVDFESDDGLAKKKYDDMGSNFPDNNLRVIFEQELYIDSPKMLSDLITIHKYFSFDIMFIDNQGTAFPIRDENDNAEAVRHVKVLRKLANLFNCAIVVYHHPSKSNNEGLRKGSGAFAWVRYCDIACNLVSPKDDTNHIVQLAYTKNRFVDSASDIYFQKMGAGMFERVVVMDLQESNAKYPVDIVSNFIVTLHGEWQRKEIIEKCTTQFDYSERLIIKSIERLTRDKKIIPMTEKYGYYEIP